MNISESAYNIIHDNTLGELEVKRRVIALLSQDGSTVRNGQNRAVKMDKESISTEDILTISNGLFKIAPVSTVVKIPFNKGGLDDNKRIKDVIAFIFNDMFNMNLTVHPSTGIPEDVITLLEAIAMPFFATDDGTVLVQRKVTPLDTYAKSVEAAFTHLMQNRTSYLDMIKVLTKHFIIGDMSPKNIKNIGLAKSIFAGILPDRDETFYYVALDLGQMYPKRYAPAHLLTPEGEIKCACGQGHFEYRLSSALSDNALDYSNIHSTLLKVNSEKYVCTACGAEENPTKLVDAISSTRPVKKLKGMNDLFNI